VKPEPFDINAEAEAIANTIHTSSEAYGTEAGAQFYGRKGTYNDAELDATILAKMGYQNHGAKITKAFDILPAASQSLFKTPEGYLKELVKLKIPNQGIQSIAQKHYGKGYGGGAGGDISDTTAWLAYRKTIDAGTANGNPSDIYLTDLSGTGTAGDTPVLKKRDGTSQMYAEINGKMVDLSINNSYSILGNRKASTGEIKYATSADGTKKAEYIKANVYVDARDFSASSMGGRSGLVHSAGFTQIQTKDTQGNVTGTYYQGDVWLPVNSAKIAEYQPAWGKSFNGGGNKVMVANVEGNYEDDSNDDAVTPVTPAATTPTFTGVPEGGF
jgi:hypothetical protein